MYLITYLHLLFFLSTTQTLGVHSTQELNLENSDSNPIRETFPHFTNLKKLYHALVKPAGNQLLLKCKGNGHPAPNITWYKNNQIVEGNHFKLKDWSLIVENITVGDSGNYKCVLCNYLGCINHTTEVEIIERFPSKPYIKDEYPKNLTVAINSTAVFECPQLLADLEPFVQWFRSRENFSFDAKIEKIERGRLLQDSSTIGNPEILRLQHITIEDEGWYTCVASNSLGHTAASGYLKVIDEYNLSMVSSSASNGMVTHLLKSWNWNVLTAFAFILLKTRKDM